MIEGIHWLGHASFRLEGEQIVYIDPYKIKGGPCADIILVSHSHYDHCSLSAIERIRKKDTVIVTSAACAGKMRGDVLTIQAGQTLLVKGIAIEATPAYNIKKPYHPRSEGGLGFVVTLNGKRIYFAGDTDRIPEMAMIKADVALLPVSGTYVMTADEAAEAVRMIRPGAAIPMHYGTIVGSRSDALRLKELAGIPVEILEQEV
ncbi:MAG: MBL fold metallo-hydrolase [Candidatus Aureabacteria bacterium]|nr:MBL fold metallo-hydrolase [Candidatus Auribacterota bacterium]